MESLKVREMHESEVPTKYDEISESIGDLRVRFGTQFSSKIIKLILKILIRN